MPASPGKFLPAEGQNVTESGYWWRRLTKGECFLCEPPAPEPVAKPAAKAAKE